MTETKALTAESQTAESQPSTQENPDQVVEVYANRLMDELFGGVERALDGDPEALTAPPAIKPETTTAADHDLTLNFSEGGLPAVLLADSSETELAYSPGMLTTADAVEAMTSSPKAGWERFWTVNRVLLGAAGLSLLATLALWIHQRQQDPVTTTAPSTVSTEVSEVSANAEFLEYLRRSLDVISQQASESASSSTTGVPDVPVALNGGALGLPPVGNNTLPPPPALSSGIPADSGSINVIERVYIPYPTAQPSATVAPAAPVPTASTPSTAPAPAPTHMLVGVLELGDRSAALFEIDGVTQRVYIGERVGDSGWSLVSVSNEEAVIRRNGEVRSIYIGQEF